MSFDSVYYLQKRLKNHFYPVIPKSDNLHFHQFLQLHVHQLFQQNFPYLTEKSPSRFHSYFPHFPIQVLQILQNALTYLKQDHNEYNRSMDHGHLITPYVHTESLHKMNQLQAGKYNEYGGKNKMR